MNMSKTMAALYPHLRKGRGPNREQNLFIGYSKHLYCGKDGSLKYQKKSLDPRIPGKTLLTRFVLLDVDTGVVYGECHEANNAKDLAGFLARAWSPKPYCMMHGLPLKLNVPKNAKSVAIYSDDLTFIEKKAGIELGEVPSGFSAGVHAVKQFENAVSSLLYQGENQPTIYAVQACSDVLSAEASSSESFLWKEAWAEVNPPNAQFFGAIDSLYKAPGGWREYPFDVVLDGIRNNLER